MEEVKKHKKDRKEFWRAVKFTIISISAGIVQTLSYTLCYEAIKLNHWIASAIGLVLSVIWNFTFNRKFTFQSASNVKVAMLKTFCYYIVFAPLSIHFADMYLVKTLGWNEILVKACTLVLNFVTEFLFQRFVVFGKSLDTNERAKAKAQTKTEQE
jgi:putative flippase GtrA